MLEIARLPNTINTLIHKNNSEMAMKLIDHFNRNIYDKDSEVLTIIKKEIDILHNKIHQKINVELEDGEAKEHDIKLLLGDNPTKEMLDSYFVKENRIKMNLLKQKLQKALFDASSFIDSKKAIGEGVNLKKSKLSLSESISTNAGNEIKFYATQVLKIFKEELQVNQLDSFSTDFGSYIQSSTSEERKESHNIFQLNDRHYSICKNKLARINTITKEFAHLLILIYDKLSYDCENVLFLKDLSCEVYSINKTVHYLTEECVVNHICNCSLAYSKSIANKVTNSIKAKSGQEQEEGSDAKLQEAIIEKFDSSIKQLKDLTKTIYLYLNSNCNCTEQDDEGDEYKQDTENSSSDSIAKEVVIQMIECYFKTFSENLLNFQSDIHISTIDFIPTSELSHLHGLISHACETAKNYDVGIDGFDNTLIAKLTEKFVKNMQTLLLYICN